MRAIAATTLSGVLGFSLGLGLGMIDPLRNGNLAAVGTADMEATTPDTPLNAQGVAPIAEDTTLENILAPVTILPEEAINETPPASSPAEDVTPEQKQDEIDALLLKRESLDQRIRTLKDRGVILIAEFTQNCGSWTDACAVPYKAELEEINAAYRDAERERSELE